MIDALSEDRLVAGIITDGHHLPKQLIKVIIRTKGVKNIFLVSDSVHLAGLKPGKYMLGNRDV